MLEHDDLHQLCYKEPLQLGGEREAEKRRNKRKNRSRREKEGRVNERKQNYAQRRHPEKRKDRGMEGK